ncbi:PH domain-containing protein [Streptomyces polyrhachis]|uniref:PH domain-containing protein n=1 Tax=Streptomyces polyrhachis TaxID=1282885 RepID=A0ABW2GFU5_9ACTN
MTPVDRYLSDDEQLVHVTRQHWTTLVDEFLRLLLIAAVTAALVWVIPGDSDGGRYARYAVLALGVLLAIRYWLIPLLQWRTTLYILTTKRIHQRTGFLSKTGRSIPLNRVNDVSFASSLWARLWRYGDLSIESASEQGLLRLRHVPDPEGLKALIYRQVDALGPDRTGH